MKKSVILILSVIYAIAIVLVGQMIKTQVYKPITYVTEIEIESEGFEYYSDDNRVGDYYGKIMLNYKEGLTYELKCRAYPYTATNTQLTYIFDSDSPICNAKETDDNSLLLEFKKKGPFPVLVKSNDGGGIQARLYIEAVKNFI